ncbi:MAG: hypothetical protein R3Y32_08220 [Bacillota bacterium]
MWIYKLLAIGVLSTLATELSVALIFKVKKTDLYIVALSNILTNPLVVLLYYLFAHGMPYEIIIIAILEITAIITEWIIYKKRTSIASPAVFAVVANAVSYGIGLMIF